MSHMHRRIRRFLRSSRAVSALEYAILVGVIAVGALAAIGSFGDSIETAITKISTQLSTAVKDVGT